MLSITLSGLCLNPCNPYTKSGLQVMGMSYVIYLRLQNHKTPSQGLNPYTLISAVIFLAVRTNNFYVHQSVEKLVESGGVKRPQNFVNTCVVIQGSTQNAEVI